jgi:hypothetical protein
MMPLSSSSRTLESHAIPGSVRFQRAAFGILPAASALVICVRHDAKHCWLEARRSPVLTL